MRDKVITVYTLADADRILKKRRKARRIRFAQITLDILDRISCALIVPGTIAAIVYIFIR